MKTKSNLVGPQNQGQGEKPQLTNSGSGRRKFLTTIAGAGAAIALLGSRNVRAQNEKTFSASNPWGGQEEKKAEGAPPEKKKTGESGSKTIGREEVERLIENTKREQYYLVPNAERVVQGSEKIECSAATSGEDFVVAVKSKEGQFEEKVVLKNADRETVAIANFEPNGNALFEDVMVISGNGKLAVCLQEKGGVPSLVQISSTQNKRMPNFFDGEDKKLKQAIGYENKGGEITIISAPENPIEGDKVLMVKISKKGEVSSSVCEMKEVNWGKKGNVYGEMQKKGALFPED